MSRRGSKISHTAIVGITSITLAVVKIEEHDEHCDLGERLGNVAHEPGNGDGRRICTEKFSIVCPGKQ